MKSLVLSENEYLRHNWFYVKMEYYDIIDCKWVWLKVNNDEAPGPSGIKQIAG
jgi:hypothetical protein